MKAQKVPHNSGKITIFEKTADGRTTHRTSLYITVSMYICIYHCVVDPPIFSKICVFPGACSVFCAFTNTRQSAKIPGDSKIWSLKQRGKVVRGPELRVAHGSVQPLRCCTLNFQFLFLQHLDPGDPRQLRRGAHHRRAPKQCVRAARSRTRIAFEKLGHVAN